MTRPHCKLTRRDCQDAGSCKQATLAVVLKGCPVELRKLMRMLNSTKGVDVVYRRMAPGWRRLYVTSQKRCAKCEQKRRQGRSQPRGAYGKVTIGEEIYSLAHVRKVEKEWVDAGIIR